ncbi:MAG TPA: hypothetical protein VFZ83_08710 [Acidimicrobiia bacterium]|nr:hypothetical protein [Acidimicrobiia bacterium]
MQERSSQPSAPVVIRTRCDACGEIRLTDEDVAVRRRVGEPDGTVAFRCPRCGLRQVHPLTRDQLRRLADDGIYAVVWLDPAEVREPRPAGPPFTPDDVLAFHELLEQPNWFERLRADDAH